MLTLGVIAKTHSRDFQNLVNKALAQPCVKQVVVAVDDDAEPGIMGYLSNRIEYFEWPLNMNFSAMRNAICQRVTEPWVLFLDTDENLLDEGWAMLPNWIKLEHDVLLLSRCNYYITDNGSLSGPVNFPDWQPKLHRRHVRWQNAVHEWPAGDLRFFNLTADPKLAIQHIKTHLDQHLANQLYANIRSRSGSN